MKTKEEAIQAVLEVVKKLNAKPANVVSLADWKKRKK